VRPTALSLVLFALAAPSASAQRGAATLSLKIDQAEIGLAERFPLTLVITAAPNEPITGIDITGISEFSIESGPEVSMSFQIDMRRGASSSVHTYRYLLAPRRVGSFLLGPATATIGGQVLRSNAVALKVVTERQLPEATDPQMFVQVSVDKTQAHLGEQVTASYYLYARVNYFGLELRREAKTDGFWVEELEVPRGQASYRQLTVGGLDYRVQLLKRQALFPLRTGKLTIGSFVLDAQTGFGFFGGGRKLSRASRPVTVEILPLPSQGRPAGFHDANVGRYALSGGVDRTVTAMGEAVKYRLQLEGQGNIKNVILPELPQGPGYRRFDPEPKITVRVENNQVAGTRVLEFLLSPTSPGRLVVPAVALHYFDPDEKAYKTTTIAEQVVTVTGATGQAVGPTANPAQPLQPIAGSDPDLRGIRDAPELRVRGDFLYRGGVFWALVIGPLVLFGAVVVAGRLAAVRSRLRLKAEPKRKEARAWKRLREAERLLETENASAFFGEISRVLLSFLEARLEQPLGSATLPELRAILEARGYPEAVVSSLIRELENCDFGRFAPRDTRADEMRNSLARSRGLLEELDRVRPTPLVPVVSPQEAR
jgi:hypothetical protein